MKMVKWKDQKRTISLIIALLILLCTYPLESISIADKPSSDLLIVYPHHNIQEIIDSAQPNTTIIFQKGTFTQSFHVSKPLTLIGSSPDTTRFSIETKPNNPAITISSPFVTLSNLTITNTANGLYTTGLRIDSKLVHISNCIFNNTPIGVAIWNDYTFISNCTFSNCSDEGILIITTSISTSHSNIIKNSCFFNNCDGIELQHSSNNKIINCTFFNNTHAGIDAICDNNNNNEISSCTFQSNNAYDIYFASSKHNQITQCTFENKSKSVVFTPSFSTNSIDETIDIQSIEQAQKPPNSIDNQRVIQNENLIQLILSKSISFIKEFIEDILSWFIQKI